MSGNKESLKRLRRLALRHKAAIVGIVILLVACTCACIAPWIAPYDVGTKVGPVFAEPSRQFLLGLDDGGTDVLSQLIWGARITLLVGFAGAAVAVTIGGLMGTLAGYSRGTFGIVLMRVTDYFLIVPIMAFMIVVAAIWGPGLWHMIVVIGILSWAMTARVVCSQVKSIRERVYILRATSLGSGHGRIIVQHVLPQVAPLLVASAVMSIASAVFSETALSFLGLGDPSSVSWGKIIENGFNRSAISVGAWWVTVPPGVCVAMVILAATLVGRAIEEACSPRLKLNYLTMGRIQRRSAVPGPVERKAS